MKVLLDTNILVAGLVEAHPHHERARPWLARWAAGEIDVAISTTIIAEAYAVLTTLPVRPQPKPAEACGMIESLLRRDVAVVSISAGDYMAVVRFLVAKSLSGRIVYDALIARAAVKAKVDRLITLNLRHLRRVWPLDPAMVHEP